MSITAEQNMRLRQAMALVDLHGHVLALFERDLVRDCIHRLARLGDRMTLTVNEWRVIEEAVGGMEATRDDAARLQARAAEAQS